MQSRVGKLASSPVISIDRECLVSAGLQLMCNRKVGCLIVLSQGEPVGILTERDIVFAANWMLGQSNITIGQVMNKQVATIHKDLTVQQVCEVFRTQHIRHLVVVDDCGRAKGIFTRSDLVRVMEKTVFAAVPDVSGIMSAKVWMVEPETTARYALSLMARHAISGVVVVRDTRPLGFFTERDVVQMITGGYDLMNATVGETFKSPAVCIPCETPPGKAIALMQKKSVRRLVVLGDRQEIVGVLTQTDLSRRLDCCQIFDSQDSCLQTGQQQDISPADTRM
jgi:predicted transcriptional regulator